MDQTQEATLFLVIFTTWMTFLYIRVFDKTVKKYILVIGAFLLFWMTTKIVKIKTDGIVNEIMWYLYYLPLLFIPTLYYQCSRYLMKIKSKKNFIFTMLISAILFLMVITNSLHNFVFKIIDRVEDVYTYNFGYYAIYIWIIGLLIIALKNLIKYNKEKRTRNLLVISAIIFIGILYTIFYNSGMFKSSGSNMPVIMGVLFCVALELFFDFNLIPNNYRYKKFFKNSYLPLEIISKDGKKAIKTNHYIKMEDKIISDIKRNRVKEKYEKENRIQTVNKIYAGYKIEERDFSKVNELKKDIKRVNQELREQEKFLKRKKEIETEIYEVKLKSEVFEQIESAISSKREEIDNMLNEMKVFDAEKMYYIKLLISYCKRMSCLVISDYNEEKYTNERMELLTNELFEDAKTIGINATAQTNKFELNTNEAIAVYEIIYEVVLNLKDTNLVLNLISDDINILLKFAFDKRNTNLKTKLEYLNLKNVTEINEDVLEDETSLSIKIVREGE